jgi:hypothetical protein
MLAAAYGVYDDLVNLCVWNKTAYEPRKAGCPAIHYNRAPHAGRTGFSFERKHGGGVRHRAERVTQPPHRHWPIRGSSW